MLTKRAKLPGKVPVAFLSVSQLVEYIGDIQRHGRKCRRMTIEFGKTTPDICKIHFIELRIKEVRERKNRNRVM